MTKVFITTKIPEIGIALLRQEGYMVEIGSEGSILSYKDIMKKAKGFDALLCQLEDHVDAQLLYAIGPQLKIVSNYAVGYDNIDVQEAKNRNIAVTNTPGVLTESVAEHAVGLVLAITRRIVEADKFVREGKFKGFDADL